MTLSHHLATAAPDQQRALIEELFNTLNPQPDHADEPEWQGPGTLREPLFHHWYMLRERFNAMLDCGAFENAVMLMVPENWQFVLDSHYNIASVYIYFDDPQHGPMCDSTREESSTLALALSSAIAKLKGL